MDVGVVAGAQEGGVGGVVWAAVGPVQDVVGSGPGGGGGAAGVGAAAVAQEEVAALAAGVEAQDAGEGEGFAAGAEQVDDEGGVAAEAADALGG